VSAVTVRQTDLAGNAGQSAVRMLTKAVALHCCDMGYDIRVNCMHPGAIHTEMVEGYVAAGVAQGATREQVIEGFASVHPMKRLGRPEEAANAILYLASDESSFTTGGDLAVDGGYLA
jgi:NAD(P)-dependent dehydrogenase (short-subunit alcohol dehydrogenase family)